MASKNYAIDKWSGTPITVTNVSWVDVYTNSNANKFVIHEALWETDDDDLLLRLEVDGIVVADLDLKELKKDYGLLDADEGSNPSIQIHAFSFIPYGDDRWAFRPPVPIECDTSFKIQMMVKPTKSNIDVERGMTSWGEQ